MTELELGSALIRLAVDPVKADVIVIAEPFTSGQVVAAVVLAVTTVGLVRLGRRRVMAEGQHEA